jgi:hypothetical protein
MAIVLAALHRGTPEDRPACWAVVAFDEESVD